MRDILHGSCDLDVLILDDDRRRHPILRRFVTSTVGVCEPVVVVSAQQAIEELSCRGHWDLLVLDHDLDGRDISRLTRHERMICSVCNHYLVRGDMEFFVCANSDGDLGFPDALPFKIPPMPRGVTQLPDWPSVRNHFLPPWEDQVRYVAWVREWEYKYGGLV